jgi:hypothetical protein
MRFIVFKLQALQPSAVNPADNAENVRRVAFRSRSGDWQMI